ncbi:hypothetical protein ABZ599_39080 [Streptomyces misionensis]|uniref:hypothetical protein n=1 Tax=Streptomyces misionensis TaxID=67331 RepID=UPI0033D22AD6
MCDLYIPEGAFAGDVESKLVKRVSDLLVEHEMRRIVDLVEDASSVRASLERAASIAWMFVHRTDTYVAGQLTGPGTAVGPVYKFVISIPEGQIDDEFVPAINRDIMAAVREAEDGRWPRLGARVWVHVHEVLDGRWGAGGQPKTLEDIVNFVAPGYGKRAVDRWNERLDTEAAALVTRGQRSAAEA